MLWRNNVNKINIFTLMMDLGSKVAEFGTGSI